MSLQIKELHIKVSVNQPATGNQPQPQAKEPGADKQQLLSDCVEQVMRIMNDKKER